MFLANENFPRPSIVLLRAAGYSITSIQEIAAGIADIDVLKMAQERNLIILTFDKDYGEIIFYHRQQNPPAVIFFREKGADPLFAGRTLLQMLQSNQYNFKNAFTVIEKESFRQRLYK